MLHSMFDFPENEIDNRKLKLVQHFCEQCRHYVPKQIQLISIAESSRSINYEAKKRKGKKKNCGLYKSDTNLYKM